MYHPLKCIFFATFSADSYLRHPNSYLPKYNIQSETDGESVAPLSSFANNNYNPCGVRRHNNGLDIGPHQIVQSDEEEDDNAIQAYGFPAQQKRRNRLQKSDIDLVLSGKLSSLNYNLVVERNFIVEN